MTNKAMVTDRYQFTNKTMGLYFGVFTDRHVFLNFGERAYKAIVSYSATVKIDWLDDGYVFTEDYIGNGN